MLVAITKTITTMNWVYGYGDVLGVVMDSDWKGGTVTIRRTSCNPETRRFRFDIETSVIHFAGRKRTAILKAT